MSNWRLKIYHALPAPLRSTVASARGYYLKSWRYGPETDRLVADALGRDYWDHDRWRVWRKDRLAFVLRRAATQVPYYRDGWDRRRRRGDLSSFERLENWPILTKDELRACPRAFVADDCDPRRMFHERTSGTSGKPLDLWWTRPTVRAWSALVEARVRDWNGVSRRDRWAILGGQPVVAGDTSEPPFWVWNRPLNQLYLSANHISPRNTPHYIEALNRHGATHLWAYSSSVAYLAQEALRQGIKPVRLKVVFTNAEPLLPWQRTSIKEGLGAEVRETYGMAEIAVAGSECPHGMLHEWPEVGWIEVLSDEADTPVNAGESGRFICTSLLNADMPLVRYELGDRGRFAARSCACGRLLPGFEGIEGRINDMLVKADGRRVYWLNPVFYGLPIMEAQILQEEVNRVVVRYVPATGFSPATADTIAERLQSRMGGIEVVLQSVDRIPREANGKFRAVKCAISPAMMPGKPSL